HAVKGGFDAVGREIERGRFRAALGHAMALAQQANQYATEQAPWTLVKEDLPRAATVLYVLLRSIDNLKLLFAPFLPFSSQALHELLGYQSVVAGELEVRQVQEADGNTHDVLTGDYAGWTGRWEPSELPPGQPLPEPKPLFKKLDAPSGAPA